jgi:hypothetical protein
MHLVLFTTKGQAFSLLAMHYKKKAALPALRCCQMVCKPAASLPIENQVQWVKISVNQ